LQFGELFWLSLLLYLSHCFLDLFVEQIQE
jgi:hypothetical protein